MSAPFAVLSALTGLLLSAATRRIILSLVAALVLLGLLAVQIPWYYSGHPTGVGEHIEVRVLASNLRKGQADPASFVALATDHADVITVSELTPEIVQRFSRAGLQQTFPHSVLDPRPGAGGIGLFSRYPFVTGASPGIPNISAAAAELDVPGVRFNPILASVHVISPLAGDTDAFTQWRDGITATKAHLAQLTQAAEPGAVIVGGDFNSTPDMRQFRDLLTDGYRDAVQQLGSGLSPTFPANRWMPPLITIDHILTRNAAASSVKTITIPGSDHRALLATVRVPLDPTAS
ncbi:endonuclease/exonuclease/phosphatase family protein [Mycolicibacterium sp. S2-37]|uniref:endonuclease/exonuclease/phosphatase family protein n=1 Tax=Mycolicibacterium sp. S2-37 TaxID=2810297 RepID=UPI0027DA79DC|nr:endonuclease/exonuclease/phosphatase family protein [Mycolicibacterium sp. S2-37]